MTNWKKINQALLSWYDQNARVLPWRGKIPPYHTWLSEIMLQQTRVDTVIPYYYRFLEALPTIEDLALADEQLLRKLWQGLGYYSRVMNMKKAAQIICSDYGGDLPADLEKLRKLPGIGEYTAGAISAIAFQLPEPAVDGNVLRVVSRIMSDCSDISDEAVRKEKRELLRSVMPKDRPGDYDQALMDLGATVCLPNGQPNCSCCPIADYCSAHQNENELSYPVKSMKLKRKVEEYTVVLLRCKNKLYLQQRPEKGLLAGLWEPFVLPGFLTEDELKTVLNARSLHPLRIQKLRRKKHVFTHLDWQMLPYQVEIIEAESVLPGIWVTPEELSASYAIPTAYLSFYKNKPE